MLQCTQKIYDMRKLSFSVLFISFNMVGPNYIFFPVNIIRSCWHNKIPLCPCTYSLSIHLSFFKIQSLNLVYPRAVPMLHPQHCLFVDDSSFHTLAVLNSVVLLFMNLSTTGSSNKFSHYQYFFTLF